MILFTPVSKHKNIKGYKVFSIFVTEHKTVVYTSNTAMK